MKISKIIVPLIIITIILSSINNKSIKINRNNYHGQRIVRASEYLILRANDKNITNYNSGNKMDMYTFSNNNILEYRYIGREPSNYLYFNCSDTSNTSTCEIWRIIGVFKVENNQGKSEFRIKIMRNDNLSYTWDNTNNFNDSNIKNYLNNGDYWYSLKGKAKNMIDTTKYYIGGISNIENGSILYNSEHSNNTNNNYPYDFYGKVGLISLSDYSYTFAYNYDNTCYNDIYNCNTNSWMKFNNITWTMTPSSNSNNVYTIGDSLHNPSEIHDIYPVAYLKYNTVIEGGNGTLNDPYVIRALTNSNIQDESELSGDRSEVNVDDTASSFSTILLIISCLIIGGGFIVFMIGFVKSRREIRKM